MKSILVLLIPVIFLSCTKEYSCEINCRLDPAAGIDTTQYGMVPAVSHYNYYTQSYNNSLGGTGNNEWGYSIPQFDTARGILDTVEIDMFTTLSCYFELTNNSKISNNYLIDFKRKYTLSADSFILVDTSYNAVFGPVNINGLSSFQTNVNILNNVEQISMVNDHLELFTGEKYIAFAYDPYSTANTSDGNYSVAAFFHDSTYIHTIYYFKKQN